MIVVVFVCDTSLRADAGHRAEGQGNICAHRIEARVARSRGDSARFFQKSGWSTPSLLGITQGLESTLPGGQRKGLAKAIGDYRKTTKIMNNCICLDPHGSGVSLESEVRKSRRLVRLLEAVRQFDMQNQGKYRPPSPY